MGVVQELEVLGCFLVIAAGFLGVVLVGVVFLSPISMYRRLICRSVTLSSREKPRIARESLRFLPMPAGSYDLFVAGGVGGGSARGDGARRFSRRRLRRGGGVDGGGVRGEELSFGGGGAGCCVHRDGSGMSTGGYARYLGRYLCCWNK